MARASLLFRSVVVTGRIPAAFLSFVLRCTTSCNRAVDGRKGKKRRCCAVQRYAVCTTSARPYHEFVEYPCTGTCVLLPILNAVGAGGSFARTVFCFPLPFFFSPRRFPLVGRTFVPRERDRVLHSIRPFVFLVLWRAYTPVVLW